MKCPPRRKEGRKMPSVIVKSKRLELPPEMARKLKGKRVEFVETKRGVLIRPVEDPIAKARGLLKGTSISTEAFMRDKQEEKGRE